MSDISELEGRITAALDRIAKGLDGRPADAAVEAEAQAAAEAVAQADAEIAGLKQALDEERTVTAQLEERVKTIKAKLDERTHEMQGALDDARGSVTALDTELQQLREVNEALRTSNIALRDANAAGLADPELINAGLMAELEALRAGRATDAAEMGAVLTQLEALLGDASGVNTPAEQEGEA